MSAGQPLAWILLGLGLPVVAAYLHRRRRVAKKVPSAILFRAIAGEHHTSRRALSRPRHLVSLVLVLAALIGLVAALADLRPAGQRPHDFVIVLDTSASMGAKPGGDGPTRLQAAVELLSQSLAGLRPGDRAALITSGEVTSVQLGFTEDLAQVEAIAAAQHAGGSAEAMTQALRIADAMARQSEDARVILFSDGVGVGVPPMSAQLQFVPVGRPGPNVGINGLAVREADALGLTEVFVAVTADVGKPREAEIALHVDDVLVDVLPIDLPAEGRVEHLHRVQLPPGQRVTARLQRHGDDVLAADDVATTPRRVGGRVAVLLVTSTRASFTAEALRLHPRVDLTIVGPYDTPPARAFDLVVLESPFEGRLPAAPRAVAFGIGADRVGLVGDRHVASPEILRWTFDSPLFRFVDLRDIDLPRADTVLLPEGWRSLIDCEAGSLAALGPWGERELMYFGFAPQESDLVLRVGFVNLMANLIEWAVPPGSGSDAVHGGVLPESESRIDPVRELAGASPDAFTRRPPLGRAPWQWLVLLGIAAIAIETLLPAMVAGRRRLRARRDGTGRRTQREAAR